MATKEAKTPKTRATLERQNGVPKPKPTTKTGRVWVIADELKGRKKDPPPRKEVIELAEKEGITPATAATQYAKWRQFHGFSKPTKDAA